MGTLRWGQQRSGQSARGAMLGRLHLVARSDVPGLRRWQSSLLPGQSRILGPATVLQAGRIVRISGPEDLRAAEALAGYAGVVLMDAADWKVGLSGRSGPSGPAASAALLCLHCVPVCAGLPGSPRACRQRRRRRGASQARALCAAGAAPAAAWAAARRRGLLCLHLRGPACPA
jgi:hypothetical protein